MPIISNVDRTGSRSPLVIFVCVHNAGRSQIAAGFLQAVAGDQVRVISGGIEPASQVNPVVVAVMREIGIDISDVTPAGLSRADLVSADYCVTMGCGDACPVVAGAEYRDWDVDDPSGLSIERVRRIRDDVVRRVDELLQQMLDGPDR